MSKHRTINDFNREYLYKTWVEETEENRRPKRGSAIKSIAFYGALIAMILLAFFYSGSRDGAKRFGPFSYNTVLTGSMQSVYPQGSLITSWEIKKGEPLKAGLENGDDIVFVRENGDVIVHRIIEIIDNYEDTGQRAFITQGVNNSAPDNWITFEGNVIGRVTWHVPYVGNILQMISQNILIFIGIIVLITVILTLWKSVFKKEEK
jgi:signal peptidase I, archaeal type